MREGGVEEWDQGLRVRDEAARLAGVSFFKRYPNSSCLNLKMYNWRILYIWVTASCGWELAWVHVILLPIPSADLCYH